MNELKRFTTFNIGGTPQSLAVARTVEELKQHYGAYVLGNGSNVLASERVSRDVVVNRTAEIVVDGCDIVADSGASLSAITAIAMRNNLKGLEWTAGIPATAGGAAITNAGANGSCMADVVKSLTVYDGVSERIVMRNEIEYGYRKSSIPLSFMILRVRFALTKSEQDLRAIYSQNMAFRRQHQPRGFTAGCIFKNPIGKSAGELIDCAGLKEYNIGDAVVSGKHANFIINRGFAVSTDVADLINVIKTRVYETSGIELEEEIRYLGDF